MRPVAHQAVHAPDGASGALGTKLARPAGRAKGGGDPGRKGSSRAGHARSRVSPAHPGRETPSLARQTRRARAAPCPRAVGARRARGGARVLGRHHAHASTESPSRTAMAGAPHGLQQEGPRFTSRARRRRSARHALKGPRSTSDTRRGPADGRKRARRARGAREDRGLPRSRVRRPGRASAAKRGRDGRLVAAGAAGSAERGPRGWLGEAGRAGGAHTAADGGPGGACATG